MHYRACKKLQVPGQVSLDLLWSQPKQAAVRWPDVAVNIRIIIGWVSIAGLYKTEVILENK